MSGLSKECMQAMEMKIQQESDIEIECRRKKEKFFEIHFFSLGRITQNASSSLFLWGVGKVMGDGRGETAVMTRDC